MFQKCRQDWFSYRQRSYTIIQQYFPLLRLFLLIIPKIIRWLTSLRNCTNKTGKHQLQFPDGDSNYFRVIYIKSRRELRCPHCTWRNPTPQSDTNSGADVCWGGGWMGYSKQKKSRIKKNIKGKGYSPRMVCLFSAGERLNTLTWSPGSVL